MKSFSSLFFHLAIAAPTRSISSQEIARVPRIRNQEGTYYMPAEDEPHEGTWIQWPHNFGWDPAHVRRYEESWINMTDALHRGERVHIIVYDRWEKHRIVRKLKKRGLNMDQLDFHAWPTDDVWIRDNGPIFAYDETDKLVVQNWKFNGWGRDADFWYDDYIPIDVADFLRLRRVDVMMVNEGGSVEVDGHGSLMAKKSSILNDNRNPGWTQQDAEHYFRQYLGVDNFIWLEGKKGADITDDHIDGTARFAPRGRIVTFGRSDFVDATEYDVLKAAQDANGDPYTIVELPITTKKITGVNDYGIYINYYVGNDVVIVPTFNDPNDEKAMNVLKSVYPDREMVGIDFVELYKDGGLVHCVTQQQPLA